MREILHAWRDVSHSCGSFYMLGMRAWEIVSRHETRVQCVRVDSPALNPNPKIILTLNSPTLLLAAAIHYLPFRTCMTIDYQGVKSCCIYNLSESATTSAVIPLIFLAVHFQCWSTLIWCWLHYWAQPWEKGWELGNSILKQEFGIIFFMVPFHKRQLYIHILS